MKPSDLYKKLTKIYDNLEWWPMDHNYHKKNNTDPRFEVIIGAILTQNTNWSNVERAIKNLKQEDKLDIESILNTDSKEIKELIKPSGFYNQKAGRIKKICKYLYEKYSRDLNLFFDKDIKTLRKELLNINGIGPETADSIILYAAEKPIFVVDAYTKRLCKRLPINVEKSYEKIQNFFQKNLSKNYSKNLTKIYNQMHAMIVELSKNYCKKKPLCKKCPIKKDCSYSKNLF